MMLCLTTPTTVGPLGVLAFFTLLYILSVGAFTGLISSISFAVSGLTKNKVLARPLVQISVRKAYLFGSIIATAPVILLAIQSFGGVSLLEFGLVLLFVAICCFVISKH